MLRTLFLISSFCHLLSCFGQRPYHENVWSSLILNYKLSKWNINADAGYRWCDHFVNTKRTSLVRFSVDRSLGKIHRLGVGYAYFEHYNTISSFENRLFLQYIAGLNLSDSKLNIRIRNELRTYNNRETGNRSRLQLSWLADLNNRYGSQLSGEVFYTPGKKPLFEQRYTLGLISKFSDNIKILAFYTAQLQSNIDYLQHIIGLQLQIETRS